MGLYEFLTVVIIGMCLLFEGRHRDRIVGRLRRPKKHQLEKSD